MNKLFNLAIMGSDFYSAEEIENFSFKDGLLPSLIAIVIVFLVLIILCLSIGLLNLIVKGKGHTVENQEATTTKNKQQKKLSIEDITDEDMMVAALIATIDYAKETTKDVRLVSIKQIN